MMETKAHFYAARGCRGMALILILMVMSTLMLVGTIAYQQCVLNQSIVNNCVSRARAFYLAEAGRAQVLALMRENLLWRGDDTQNTGYYRGGIGFEKGEGNFDVTLTDCTDDGNGLFSSALSGGCLKVMVTGNYRESTQVLSCMLQFKPNAEFPANAPFQAVVTSGRIEGPGAFPITGKSDLGVVSNQMVASETTLPDINHDAVVALSDIAFSNLDNDEFDTSLSETSSFWKDRAHTQPFMIFVNGNLTLSGERCLHGIIFVAGDRVTISEDVTVNGILYIPNASQVCLQYTTTSSLPIVTGQLIVGASGIDVTGNPISVQLNSDYVDAMNRHFGAVIGVDIVPGSWNGSESYH